MECIFVVKIFMDQHSQTFYKKCAAIIVAGGSGLRMNSTVPKQFLPLKGKPVLYYSIHAFQAAIPGIKIILVLPEAHFSYANTLLQYFEGGTDITIIKGGNTRFHSVQNGVHALEDEAVTFIHDGVRPFVSAKLIQNCYEKALQSGSAIPCVKVSDSIRQVNAEDSASINREMLRAIQTPQTFQSEIIRKTFEQEYREEFTDEATAAEYAGFDIHLIEGDKHNIKITTPEDLLFAEALLSNLTIW